MYLFCVSIADSSMHRFLTSPFDSQDLNLHMSSTASVPSSMQVMGRTPAGDEFNENLPGNGLVSLTNQSPGLPQDLLMRQESSSEYDSSEEEDSETPDPFASQASSQEDIAEAIKGALDELELTSSSFHSSFNEEERPLDHGVSTSTMTAIPHGIATLRGHVSGQTHLTSEGGLTTMASCSPLCSSPIVQTSMDSSGGVAYNGDRRLHHEGDLSTLLKLEELTLGRGESGENKASLNRDRGGGVSKADETLIGDEIEPSLMREADEFSRFNPSHLASMLETDSLALSSKSRDHDQSAISTSAVVTCSSKLSRSLPPLNDRVSKITHSEAEINSSMNGTKLYSSLPVDGSTSTEKDKPLLTAAGKESLNLDQERTHEGGVSSRTEGGFSFIEASSSVLSGGGSPAHSMEVQ